MPHIDKISHQDTSLSREQFDLVRRILRKNLTPDAKCSPGVFIRVARMKRPYVRPAEHDLHLAFAKADQNADTGRCLRAINMICEIDGVPARLVDNVADYDGEDVSSVPVDLDTFIERQASGKLSLN